MQDFNPLTISGIINVTLIAAESGVGEANSNPGPFLLRLLSHLFPEETLQNHDCIRPEGIWYLFKKSANDFDLMSL